MAAVPKSGTPSYSSLAPPQSSSIVGLLAGEIIDDGDACYIKASDNKVWKATGAAANEAARVAGFAFVKTYVDDAITLVCEGNFRYGAGLSPGASYFLSGTTAGGLDTIASTGGIKVVAQAIDATRIRILPGGLG